MTEQNLDSKRQSHQISNQLSHQVSNQVSHQTPSAIEASPSLVGQSLASSKLADNHPELYARAATVGSVEAGVYLNHPDSAEERAASQ